MNDPMLGDALALVRAMKSVAGREMFASVVNHTDEAEQHKLIVRLAALVDLAVGAEDWEHLQAKVDELDELGGCGE